MIGDILLPDGTDIVSADIAEAGWIVTGWFTPDYRPLAEAFAANLSEHGAPFHLFAKPTSAVANRLELILIKPRIVIEAMEAYPGKTVVLMDVDCIVRADPSPMLQFTEDVGIVPFAGGFPNRPTDWRVWLGISTRVVVFRPTDSARAFAQAWAGKVAADGGHEERCFAMAFLANPTVRFAYLDVRYSAREIGRVPGAVIEHDSANHKNRRPLPPWRRLLRTIEAPFRTGRSKTRKQLQGPPIVLEAEPYND